jgi:hypothetical protein
VTITNATLLDRPVVDQALSHLDAHGGQVWAKLDAGTQAWYERVERTKIPLARIVDNLAFSASRRPLIIQSLFLALGDEAPSESEIAAWVAHLAAIRQRGGAIRLVQVYTVARAPAESFARPLPVGSLEAIAAQARGAGFAVDVHP